MHHQDCWIISGILGPSGLITHFHNYSLHLILHRFLYNIFQKGLTSPNTRNAFRIKKYRNTKNNKKKSSLEKTEQWLQNYLEQNPDDTEARDDLEKVKKEIEAIV